MGGQTGAQALRCDHLLTFAQPYNIVCGASMAKESRGRVRKANAADSPLPAVQERSRATTEHLLTAAEDLLRTGGAEAATLRGIAEHAGVSLAIVYRRFPDKDAVLRAVYTNFFDRLASTNARVVTSERLRGQTLEQLAGTLVSGIADGYRRNRALLRALVLYARTHSDRDFRVRAARMSRPVFAEIEQMIEQRSGEVSHPQPEVGVPFALAAAAGILAERLLFDDLSNVPPLPYDQLIEETKRLFLAYLQWEPRSTRRR